MWGASHSVRHRHLGRCLPSLWQVLEVWKVFHSVTHLDWGRVCPILPAASQHTEHRNDRSLQHRIHACME